MIEVQFDIPGMKRIVTMMSCVPTKGDYVHLHGTRKVIAVDWAFYLGKNGSPILKKPYVIVLLKKPE